MRKAIIPAFLLGICGNASTDCDFNLVLRGNSTGT